ncbi:uncharacterized protein LOC129594508 [Paramacrobiotus metropolitanus]|uniref:uncharacterized protein LOC129594508 n=1 Tax=Paramacrobiotus metropolitanus TaxID=2943436 RepID=UPI0024456071|nr:uncharacterized protein LOC129594508 [Paramacrobiotus metropolitanus]
MIATSHLFVCIVIAESHVVVGALHDRTVPKYETECENSKNPPPKAEGFTSIEILPFRTDRVTADECHLWHEMDCGNGQKSYCYGPSGISSTYFTMDCVWGGTRSAMAVFARNISKVSPQRAIFVEMVERNDTEDPVHPDVFQPIHKQLIRNRRMRDFAHHGEVI